MNLPSVVVATLALPLLGSVLLCPLTIARFTATHAMSTSTRSGGRPIVVHWFRGMDLRLHDNPALDRSVKLCANTDRAVIPIFCFDPRIFGDAARSTPFGSLKCGPRRARFMIESIVDLRASLEKKGSRLLVAVDRPENFIKTVLKEMKTSRPTTEVIYQDEVCSEERAVESKVKKLFGSAEAVWGSTLYNLDDLPYDHEGMLPDLPDTFTPFRNKVEKKCTIHNPLVAPKVLPTLPSLEAYPTMQQHASYMPSLKDLGYTDEQVQSIETIDPRGVMPFHGGETAALHRVQDYIWDKDLLRTYFDTRNGMIGGDYSSKMAPWLAHGCVSPRYIARECTKYEEQRVANKSTYWLVFEILWRDFFKFFALKHGTSLFAAGGTIGSDKPWKHYEKNVQAWIGGKTGFPMVDANMRELAASGFMSNRGRQNVASFLALELNQDWRYGADYFESTLLDYDVHSNWGNWCAAAGMTGGRLNRFNIVKQSKDYDQHGDYVRHWLPELKDVPTPFVHEPWKMSPPQQTEYNCRLGVDYPNPIAKPFYPEYKNGNSRRQGGGRGGRGGNRNKNNNRNRSKGQRNDMKSLKQGTYRMD